MGKKFKNMTQHKEPIRKKNLVTSIALQLLVCMEKPAKANSKGVMSNQDKYGTIANT